jgi:hypothetical protein
VGLPRAAALCAARLALAAVAVGIALACSTGDSDTAPADGGRIGRTTAHVDSALDPARAHIRAVDSLGEGIE